MTPTPQTQIRIKPDLKLAAMATYTEYGAKSFAECINGILHVIAYGLNPEGGFNAIQYLEDAKYGLFTLNNREQYLVSAKTEEISIFFKYMTANYGLPLRIWSKEVEIPNDVIDTIIRDIFSKFDYPLRRSEVRRYWQLWINAAEKAGWTREYQKIVYTYLGDSDEECEAREVQFEKLAKKYKDIVVYPPPKREENKGCVSDT